MERKAEYEKEAAYKVGFAEGWVDYMLISCESMTKKDLMWNLKRLQDTLEFKGNDND